MTARPAPQKLPKPHERILKVYAFDPSRGTELDNHLTIRIPYERLDRGPIGEKIAVIDYDGTNECYYEPVDLNSPDILALNGLDPCEAIPQFHQQMVYAVAMETIRRFEFALGRRVRWAPVYGSSQDSRFRGKLKIFPHAMQEANAFYHPKTRALLFGYFQASAEDPGTNLPGQIVYTCLSHDIIAHETTHAILDGIRRRFREPSSVDTSAFHEGFADIVALLQHFSLKESLLDTIQRTGGLIHRGQLSPDVRPDRTGIAIDAEMARDNPLVELARQFGEAMGNRRALRSALGTQPNSLDIEVTTEPHARGAILVAAVFDAFFTIYIKRTRDLMRIAYPDGRNAVPNYLHPDLANRLADEAARTAATILNICVRALDYCPPVDIRFGDYLRALVTADYEVAPKDEMGYRAALIHAFRSRGIRPEGVVSYSVESLLWPKMDDEESPARERPNFLNVWEMLDQLDRAEYDTDESEDEARRKVFIKLWERADAARGSLGLSKDRKMKVAAQSFYQIRRITPEGTVRREVVAEFVQTVKEVEIFENQPELGKFTFRGGSTLIIQQDGQVKYSISKPIEGEEGKRRLEEQRQFYQQAAMSFGLAPYVNFDPDKHLTYCAVHRGY